MTDFFTRDNEKLSQFNEWLKNAQNIVVTSHQNPDGDAFGSTLGLFCFLKKFNFKSLTFISPTDYADFIAWMPHAESVIVYNQENKTLADGLINDADLVFCLDYSSVSRMKDMKEAVLASKSKKIVIDHHEQPEGFGDLYYWDQHASSASELVYNLIVDLGYKDKIDLDTATCIYTGLLTDTGSFRFPSTSPGVHRIAAELLEIGVNPSEINRNLFDNNPFTKLQFLGYVLSKKMTHLPDYRTCILTVSEKELKKYDSKTGDTEGIVNYGLQIEGVVMSAIFIEKEGMIKISFRSIHDFSVADIARDYFEGGGHKNAAGGKSYLSLEQTVEKFVNLLPFYKKTLALQPK